jgi:hypothetical protein
MEASEQGSGDGSRGQAKGGPWSADFYLHSFKASPFDVVGLILGCAGMFWVLLHLLARLLCC